MIGCVGYSDVISCSQYLNDVQQIKFIYVAILIIVAGSLIYFSKSMNYKSLTKKYVSLKTLLSVPILLSYTFFAVSIVYSPLLLSIHTSLQGFMYFVYAFIWPNVTWVLVMSFGFGVDWLFQKLGFSNFKSFMRAVWKK